MKRYISMVFIALFMLYSAALGQEFRNISADELKKMTEENKAVMVVDARTPGEFRLGHIPKAINIPPEKNGAIGELLPGNKDTAIVVYCRGGSG